MTHDPNDYILGKLIGANMNSTADQAIAIGSSRYAVRRIVACNTSLSLTLAIGGIYTAAAKGGTAIVAAIQAWSALTGSTKFLDAALAGTIGTDIRTETTLYLSLTTAQGAAATMDLYVIGDKLD